MTGIHEAPTRKAGLRRKGLYIVLILVAILLSCSLSLIGVLAKKKRKNMALALSLTGARECVVIDQYMNYPFLQGEGLFALDLEIPNDELDRIVVEWNHAPSNSMKNRPENAMEGYRMDLMVFDISYPSVDQYYYQKVCLRSETGIWKQDYVVLLVHSRTDSMVRVGVSTGHSFVRDWQSGKGAIVYCPEVNLLQDD